MTRADQVENSLRPFLGSVFLRDHSSLMERVALMLFGFRPERDSLQALAQRLDNLLFMAVRDATSARMLLEMDNNQLVRLRMSDFALMADELLYLTFENLEVNPQNQAMLRDYSLRNQSFSALRALYCLYQDLQSPEETKLLYKIITNSHPPWRYRHWLDRMQ
jgi:hypothetical protein